MMQDSEAVHRPCAQCGAAENVVYLSPDMDIEPVPLCVVCRFTIFSNRHRDLRPPPG